MKKNFLVASGLVLALVLLLAAFPVQAWYSPCFCTIETTIWCGNRCLERCISLGGCESIEEVRNVCGLGGSCIVEYSIRCGDGYLTGGPCVGSEYCPTDCNNFGGGPLDPPYIIVI